MKEECKQGGFHFWVTRRDGAKVCSKCLKELSEDMINRPSHYYRGNIDVIGFAELQFDKAELKGFYRINCLKYLTRYDRKNGIEDLKKGQFLFAKINRFRGARQMKMAEEHQRLMKFVIDCIENERYRQNELYGIQRFEMTRWLAVLVEEVGEVAQCLQNGMASEKETDAHDLFKELIQVAAVAAAMAEQVKEELGWF